MNSFRVNFRYLNFITPLFYGGTPKVAIIIMESTLESKQSLSENMIDLSRYQCSRKPAVETLRFSLSFRKGKRCGKVFPLNYSERLFSEKATSSSAGAKITSLIRGAAREYR